MLLEKDKYNKTYRAYSTCEPDEVEIMQEALNSKTVMVDWQYNAKVPPIQPLVSLKDNIRDAMGAPWYDPDNYSAYVDTASEYDAFGIMMTTWHTLREKMPSVLGCAKNAGQLLSHGRKTTVCVKRRQRFFARSVLKVMNIPTVVGQKNR